MARNLLFSTSCNAASRLHVSQQGCSGNAQLTWKAWPWSMRSYSSTATPAGITMSMAIVAVFIDPSLNSDKVLTAALSYNVIRKPQFRQGLHLKTEEPQLRYPGLGGRCGLTKASKCGRM